QHEDAPERLLRGLELVRAVENQLLAEQEQPGEFARLDDGALAVLPGHDERDLERRPSPVGPFAERLLEDELLPRVKIQTRCRGELDGLLARAADRWRHAHHPR